MGCCQNEVDDGSGGKWIIGSNMYLYICLVTVTATALGSFYLLFKCHEIRLVFSLCVEIVLCYCQILLYLQVIKSLLYKYNATTHCIIGTPNHTNI